MHKRALAISGGSTKIAFFIGAILMLRKKYNFRYLIGTSSGAIVVSLMALNRYDLLKRFAYNYTLKTIFGVNVSKTIHQILGAFRLVTKGYMFEYKGLEKILKEEIKEADLEYYKYNRNSHDCFIHCFNLETNKNVYYDLRTLNKDELINAILASCSIPFWVSAKNKLYDGGLGKHNAGIYLLMNFHDITEIWTLWSRVRDIKRYKWPFTYKLLRLLERIFEVFILHQSKRDERDIIKFCKHKGVKHYSIFPSFILTRSTFETEIEKNKKMYYEGINRAKEAIQKQRSK